ncbi:uncharacterized protein LOC132755557 [Ruditapes philippinarum]|uniref:uncharacterized protein LOC132755557 n=1 Tax=Ruditapes philippinarum TaxID=129788 RepID=UPI00295B191F|nr:uncharacterized protein LOC132755557 [Ruditapes philippinarum]
MIYDHKKIHNESKYFESKDGDSFVLSISAVKSKDIGNYLVNCGNPGYTNRSYLKVAVNGCNEKCGEPLFTNNITEEDSVTFKLTVYPGKDVTVEKKLASTFGQIKGGKYNITEFAEERMHSLYILEKDFSDRDEHRVNCGNILPNSIRLNIVSPENIDVNVSDVAGRKTW